MNISVADPPKQCCLLPNETIVKDIVRHLMDTKDVLYYKSVYKRLMTHPFWKNVIFSILTTSCGIILRGQRECATKIIIKIINNKNNNNNSFNLIYF